MPDAPQYTPSEQRLLLLAAHLSSDARVRHLPEHGVAFAEKGTHAQTACGRTATWKDVRRRLLPVCRRCQAAKGVV